MSGHHPHSHDHGAKRDYSRAFAIGIALNLMFVGAEFTFGILADSIALIADAGHNLSDVLGLAVAWGGAAMARRSAGPRFTFGLKKGSILAALINSILLMVAVGVIAAEGLRRLLNPVPVQGEVVAAVAAFGILINGATALFFASGRHGDVNVRAAFLHMAADAAVSAAVVVGGIVIWRTGQLWVDPALSLAVAAVIFWSSFGLLKESVWMTLAGVPAGIEVDEVEAALGGVEGVTAVHDLHIWALSTTETALTAHLVVPEAAGADGVLRAAQQLLHDQFGIDHSTIQVERAAIPACDDC